MVVEGRQEEGQIGGDHVTIHPLALQYNLTLVRLGERGVGIGEIMRGRIIINNEIYARSNFQSWEEKESLNLSREAQFRP